MNFRISKEAQALLDKRGVGDVFALAEQLPGELASAGGLSADLFALLGYIQKKLAGDKLTRARARGWSKGRIRELRQGEPQPSSHTYRWNTGSLIPAGVSSDSAVVRSFIHNATSGAHYKKPRRQVPIR